MSWVVMLGLVALAAEPGGAAEGPLLAAPTPLIERLPAVPEEFVAWPMGQASEPVAQAPLADGPSTVEPLEAAAGGSARESPAATTPPEAAEGGALRAEPRWWLRPTWLKPWKGSFEVGLDGSSGNSETLNLRLGVDAKRKTELHVFSFDLDYHKNTSESQETAHRLNFDWRYELLFPHSPWSWFSQGTTIYDEFQPWDVRVSVTTGVGYHFLDTEATSLVGRFGGGFSQDIGGPDPRYVPELNYGIDFEHQINRRQKVKASVEYYPDVTAFGDFRVVTKADWEVLLDEEMNLSLKLSATDRYKRPNPGGKPNDVDYSMVLLWKF